MKYLKTYKIFMNTINWDLIDDAKDIALEYVDEYMILNYFICSRDGKRVFYGGDLRNDGSRNEAYVKYNGEPVAYKILICSKPYDKNLGTTNHPNIVQFNDSLEKETKEVVDRLRYIYPNEDIVGLRRESVLESVFVSKEDVDELLDKINKSGITSLSDIDRNRLTLFSEGDKEIIETIEKMADITNQFRELNAEMRRCQDSGESDGFHLMKDWMKLNNQLRPLEASFRKWGIELGDPRLDRLMRKVRPDAYNRHVIESVSDDSDTMARYQLFGADAKMAFNFGDKYITNPDEIKEVLKVYKETYSGWGGGPESSEFIDYFNNKYNTKLTRKAWYPTMSLIINTVNYGDLVIGYGIKDKKARLVNWDKLKDEKELTDEYDKKVLGEIHKIAWKIYKSMTIDDTINLLNLNVKNKIDWDWSTNESKEKAKKKKRIKRYSQFKVSTDKQFTWSPDFNKNSPAPSSTVAIAPLK